MAVIKEVRNRPYPDSLMRLCAMPHDVISGLPCAGVAAISNCHVWSCRPIEDQWKGKQPSDIQSFRLSTVGEEAGKTVTCPLQPWLTPCLLITATSFLFFPLVPFHIFGVFTLSFS